jgi:hypothetical protein
MEPLTPLARISIILSWVLVGLACFSTSIQLVWLFWIKRSRLHVADGCVCAALVVGIVLVAQMTWAIVDEGSGRHQAEVLQEDVAALAKVRGIGPLLSVLLT